MKFYLLIVVLIAKVCLLLSTRTIIDTDIGPWSDDVGTLAMLYNYMDMKVIEILAIVSSNPYEGAAGVIDVMNTYFKHPEIPIGITRDPNAVINKGITGFVDYALANFSHPKYSRNEDAEDAVKLYRRVLANAPDKSVVITVIGYYTNIANLLNSRPDEISGMSGYQLVKRKVRSMVTMAGEFPGGYETNIIGHPEEVREVLRKWSLPITFIGSEVGNKLRCGANLLNKENNRTYYPNSPVGVMYELAYNIYGLDGCYDHSAAIILARGYGNYFRPRYGNIYVNETGYSTWRTSFLNIWTLRNHVEIMNVDHVLNEINNMMVLKID